jgi:hypothetical protein
MPTTKVEPLNLPFSSKFYDTLYNTYMAAQQLYSSVRKLPYVATKSKIHALA